MSEKPLAAAVKMLSLRLYSTAELRCKLLAKGYSPAEVELTLDELQRRGYLNDATLCDMIYRKYHAACKHSGKAIIAKLKARGFDDALIKATMQEYADLDESRAALNLLYKRYRNPEQVDSSKWMRYLAGKGFSYAIISQAARLLNDPIM